MTDKPTEGSGEPGAEDSSELPRLPRGPHDLSREFVIDNQRERLLAALVITVADDGYASTTISKVTRRATVSWRSFYELFESKEDCFLAAYEEAMGELRGRFAQAFEQEGEWAQAIRAGIAAMLAFLEAEPNLARLCMVEAMVAGSVASKRYEAAIESFVPYFREGREGRPKEIGDRLSASTEETLVGGVFSVISRQIRGGGGSELESLLAGLVEFALTPYLGGEEAAEIAGDA